MATPAEKASKKQTSGPKGTAAQRASKTTTRGREQVASKKVRSDSKTKLPNRQGT